MYTLKAITSLTGLTAETLRAWERRYGCIIPNRNAHGRRSYSQEDLDKLKLLANLTRNGHAIGKIAHLDCDALRRFQQQSTQTTDNDQTALFSQLEQALVNYRIEQCEQLLKLAMLAYDPLTYARDVLLPALNRVGQLWHDEKINIAQEHMFSGCVKRLVLSMVNNLHHPSQRNPSMLFATLSGEPHEFGILLGCLIAASLQYTCYYVGADLPAADIVDACEHLQPDTLVIGLVKTPPEQQTQTELEKLAHYAANAETELWLAGEGAAYWLERQGNKAKGFEFIQNMDRFHAKAQQQQLAPR